MEGLKFAIYGSLCSMKYSIISFQ